MKSFLFAVLAVVVVSLVADSAFAGNCAPRGSCGARNAPRNAPPIVEVRVGRFGRTRVFTR